MPEQPGFDRLPSCSNNLGMFPVFSHKAIERCLHHRTSPESSVIILDVYFAFSSWQIFLTGCSSSNGFACSQPLRILFSIVMSFCKQNEIVGRSWDCARVNIELRGGRRRVRLVKSKWILQSSFVLKFARQVKRLLPLEGL